MAWKLKYIKICNFKFFHKEFTLQPDGRNVVLYGENGAGKSSIYWSLYTHFQAVSKSVAQAQKYFLPDNPESLRNRCSDSADDSYISVCFEDEKGSEKVFTDGRNSCYISNPESKKFMKATAFGSDFLNYKFLSSLFDFKNSEENEVFGIFRQQILPFLSFEETLVGFDGQDTGDANAANWLEWLEKEISTLPRYARKRHIIDTGSEKYRKYKRVLDRFNDLLNSEINDIVTEANLRLKDKFKADIKLHYEFHRAYVHKKDDGVLVRPRLLLHAEMTGKSVTDKSMIKHPKSFFNEAKITSMALAIRLAIINSRSPLDQGGGILVLDDLLISLDMSLRQVVLPMILEHASRHQLIILTHDRSIFNMVRQFVVRKEGTKDKDGRPADYGIWDRDWYACEMYVKDTADGVLEPFFAEKKSYLDRARAHLLSFRVPECANALRQCCEAKIKELLGSNHLYAVDRTDGELTDPTLSNFIGEFDKERKKKNFPDLFPSIDGDRQRILNPFSHDDIETPYYMGELRKALQTMERLDKVKRIMPVPMAWIGDKSRTFSFWLTYISDAGVLHFSSVKFCFLENFDIWKYDGRYYHGNPTVYVISAAESSKKNRVKSLDGMRCSLNKLYEVCYKSVSFKASTAPSVLDEIIDDSIHRVIEIE